MLPSLLRSTISPSFVERLTPAAESVAQAHHELRWMVQELNRRTGTPAWDSTNHDAELEKMVRRREKGEPLQYVLGNQPFGPLLLTVRPPTLIPRPETEEWTLRLASLLPSAKPLRILDLCTGSGCIPLALLHALPQSQAVGVDLSSRALGLAEENAQLHGLNDRFRTVAGDLFAEGWAPRWVDQHGRVDVVTSNPPYIPAQEIRTLEKGVRDWEDERALIGDVSKPTSIYPSTLAHLSKDRGLDFYALISSFLPALLSPRSSTNIDLPSHPRLVLEVGHDQAREVEALLNENVSKEVLERVEIWEDAMGKERVVVGY